MFDKRIDLHTHTTASDGTYTPAQLVDYAVEKGLCALAITDHDTIDGLEEAMAHAAALPPETAPVIVPGIELSTEYHGRDIHMVGLCVDYKQPEFNRNLKNFIDSRDLRNQKMCRLLTDSGFPISYEELMEAFPDSVITRAHFGRLMLSKGYVKSLKEAFDRYLGDHCSCYVPREKITPTQAIELILGAGGIPVLAHPVLYGLGRTELDQLIHTLADAGLLGIEAVYSTYVPADERKIRSYAAQYHLAVSGGSDFHGANKPKIDLGMGTGMRKGHISYSLLTDLLHRAGKDNI